MTSMCTNTDNGKCDTSAAASLVVKIDNMIYPTDSAINLCTAHLLAVIVRNGITPDDGVDLITRIGTRIAFDILAHEEIERRTLGQ